MKHIVLTSAFALALLLPPDKAKAVAPLSSDELKEHCGLYPEEGQERIKPMIPDPVHAKYLDMNEGEPALEIDRRTMAGGKPLEWRLTLVRGDLYNFRAEWNAEDTVVVPRLVAE